MDPSLYLKEEGLENLLAHLVDQLIQKRPKDTRSFMLSYIDNEFENRKQLSQTSLAFVSPTFISLSLATGDDDDIQEDLTDSDMEEEGENSDWTPPQPSSLGRRFAISSESVDPATLDTEEELDILPPKNEETLEKLSKALDRNALFARLDAGERGEVFRRMRMVTYQAGDVIIQQGDTGNDFYVLESGHCQVWKSFPPHSSPPKMVLDIYPGGSFGELALMYGSPRAASVHAVTLVQCWAIDRVTYRRVMMGSTLRRRKLYESFLSNVPILAHLEPYERLLVADALESVSVEDGNVIVQQGDPGEIFYLIVQGECEVFKEEGGVTNQVALLGPSQYFGEIALLTQSPRAATVQAKGPVVLAKLDRERFARVLGPCQDILRRNMEHYRLGRS